MQNEEEDKSLRGASLARLICRRVSDSAALTNELWKAARKGWRGGSDPQKGVDDTVGAKGSEARGSRNTLDVAAEIEYHAF